MIYDWYPVLHWLGPLWAINQSQSLPSNSPSLRDFQSPWWALNVPEPVLPVSPQERHPCSYRTRYFFSRKLLFCWMYDSVLKQFSVSPHLYHAVLLCYKKPAALTVVKNHFFGPPDQTSTFFPKRQDGGAILQLRSCFKCFHWLPPLQTDQLQRQRPVQVVVPPFPVLLAVEPEAFVPPAIGPREDSIASLAVIGIPQEQRDHATLTSIFEAFIEI